MRKINDGLIERMVNGDLMPLLNYIKADDALRLEVRQKGEAIVYYRKGKALEIRKLKVDQKYGDVPSTQLAVDDPPRYFIQIKECIDRWLNSKKERAEFDTQQYIAQSNQNNDDKYFILDMEYAFEQYKIEKNQREKRAVFDLIGIERKTNKIIFFEVKKGLKATQGKSGIEEHINDFEVYLFGKNSKIYKTNLINDIRNIVEDKRKLGLIHNFDIPGNLGQSAPELVFVFHPDNNSQITNFEKELNNRHKLIIVNSKDYRLI